MHVRKAGCSAGSGRRCNHTALYSVTMHQKGEQYMNVYAQATAVREEVPQLMPLYDAREGLFNELGRRRRLRRDGHDPNTLVSVPPQDSILKQY